MGLLAKVPCWLLEGCLSSSQWGPLLGPLKCSNDMAVGLDEKAERERVQGGNYGVFYLFSHILVIGSESLSPDNA